MPSQTVSAVSDRPLLRGLQRGDQDFSGQIAVEAAKLFRRNDDHFVTPTHVLRAFAAHAPHQLAAARLGMLQQPGARAPSAAAPVPGLRLLRVCFDYSRRNDEITTPAGNFSGLRFRRTDLAKT